MEKDNEKKKNPLLEPLNLDKKTSCKKPNDTYKKSRFTRSDLKVPRNNVSKLDSNQNQQVSTGLPPMECRFSGECCSENFPPTSALSEFSTSFVKNRMDKCKMRRLTSNDWIFPCDFVKDLDAYQQKKEQSTGTTSTGIPPIEQIFSGGCCESSPQTSALSKFSGTVHDNLFDFLVILSSSTSPKNLHPLERLSSSGGNKQTKKELSPQVTFTESIDVPSLQTSSRKRKSSDECEPCKITDKDVLLGRGGLANNNPGNIRYRKLVEELRPWYHDCQTKTCKKTVSELLVHYVHSEGGRFLQESRKRKGKWVEADYDSARKKSSQALRETKWKSCKSTNTKDTKNCP